MRAIIVGGGIGGAACAIALRRAGIEPTVFERAPEPREVGAGISLWSNALRALRAIGADGPVVARGEAMRVAEIRTWRGRVLKRQEAARFGGDTPVIVMIHRAELLAALLGQLPAGTVRFGSECAGVEDTADVATARIVRDGGQSRFSADVLVGADGIRSVVRAGLKGPEPVRYSGYTCWRGVAEIGHDLVEAGYVAETWGHGSRFGITRIGGGRVYWWAAANAPEGGADAGPGEPVTRLFAGWSRPVPQLIAATPAAAIIRNDIVDRPPIRGWGRGRITLLGDAAHPTTPNLGQGGCMAIEDGVVLARKLAGCEDPVAALRSYEASRYARTAMITNASWRIGAVGHWECPAACWARNTVTRLIPSPLIERQQRTLLEFYPER
jgi:2-polyprenyl-6-methoxyphenol hydroxylase-like FAD-dependent oxidoreductase